MHEIIILRMVDFVAITPYFSLSISLLSVESPCMVYYSYLLLLFSCKGLGSRPTSVEPPHLIPSSTPHQQPYQHPQHQQPQGVVQQFQQQEPDAAGLRRVCSLSDLTKSSGEKRRMLPAPPISGRPPHTINKQRGL